MKKISIIGFLILILVTMVACSSQDESMSFGSMPTYSAAIYAVGIEKGFFEKAGVKVDLTIFRSAMDRDSAATAGQLDGFMTDMMGAINLKDKGFNFMMTSAEYEQFTLLSGVNADLDLAGKKVAISENTVVEYVVDTYINEEIEKVSIPSVPDRMGALLAGEVDFGVFPDPFTGIIIGKGAKPLVNTVDKDFQPVVVVFDGQYIEDNEEAIQAFYKGYKATLDYMKTSDYSDYKEALVTYGLATEDTVDLYRIPVDQYGINPVNEDNYDAVMTWMLDKEIVKSKVEFSHIYMGQYVD